MQVTVETSNDFHPEFNLASWAWKFSFIHIQEMARRGWDDLEGIITRAGSDFRNFFGRVHAVFLS